MDMCQDEIENLNLKLKAKDEQIEKLRNKIDSIVGQMFELYEIMDE